jgi:hypothetical protein
VVNKIDQPATWDVAQASQHVSALTNAGLDALIAAIVRKLVPHPPRPGEGVPITEAHRRRLAELAATSRDRCPMSEAS